jgi:hypothetical protein
MRRGGSTPSTSRRCRWTASTTTATQARGRGAGRGDGGSAAQRLRQQRAAGVHAGLAGASAAQRGGWMEGAPTALPARALSMPAGAGVHVYVLDTGVRTTHREFGVCIPDASAGGACAPAQPGGAAGTRVAGGFNAVDSGASIEDCHGHGTHVRGGQRRGGRGSEEEGAAAGKGWAGRQPMLSARPPPPTPFPARRTPLCQVAAIVGGLTYGVAKNVTIHPVKVRRWRPRRAPWARPAPPLPSPSSHAAISRFVPGLGLQRPGDGVLPAQGEGWDALGGRSRLPGPDKRARRSPPPFTLRRPPPPAPRAWSGWPTTTRPRQWCT